jgi:hypothetical protein
MCERSGAVSHRAKLLWLLALMLLASLLAGCTLPHPEPPIPTATPSPLARAQVTRISAFPSNHIAAFEADTANPTEAQQLYAALLALPTTDPAQFRSCPADAGIAYRISFYRVGGAGGIAWVKPDGCRQAKIGESNALHDTNPQFWQTFASVLNVNEDTLFDLTPHPTGPYAPAPSAFDWVGS